MKVPNHWRNGNSAKRHRGTLLISTSADFASHQDIRMAKEGSKEVRGSVRGSRRGKHRGKTDANSLANQVLGGNNASNLVKVTQSTIGNAGIPGAFKPVVSVFDDSGVDVTPLPLVSPNVLYNRAGGGKNGGDDKVYSV